MDGCTLFYYFIILVAAYADLTRGWNKFEPIMELLGTKCCPMGKSGHWRDIDTCRRRPVLAHPAYNVENSTIFGLTKYFFSFGFRLHRTVSCSEFYLLSAYLKFMTYHIRIGFWNHNPVFLIPFVRFGISAQMTSKVMKTLKYWGNINCWHIAVKLLLLLGPKFWAKPIWIFASLAYVYLT